jgi:5-methylcytosine-specific restriction endonuclease McrA
MSNSSNRNSKKRKNLRKRLYERDNGICQICDWPVSLEEFTIDHIIPRSKGGPNSFDNMQITHAICNNNRGNKDYVKVDLFIELVNKINISC